MCSLVLLPTRAKREERKRVSAEVGTPKWPYVRLALGVKVLQMPYTYVNIKGQRGTCNGSFFFYYKFIYFNWRLITLQYCIGFAIHQHKSATGIHVFPILNPAPTSLPVPSLWVILVHQPQTSCIMHRTWTGVSFHIWYYTCFNAILPNHPTLSLSHRVQKTVLYISVSFAVWYTGLLLPSF